MLVGTGADALGVRDRARSLSLAREVEQATWTCPEHAAHWRYAGTHCDVCIANGFFGAAMASDAEIAFGAAGHAVHEKERATFACPSAEAACRLHPIAEASQLRSIAGCALGSEAQSHVSAMPRASERASVTDSRRRHGGMRKRTEIVGAHCSHVTAVTSTARACRGSNQLPSARRHPHHPSLLTRQLLPLAWDAAAFRPAARRSASTTR